MPGDSEYSRLPSDLLDVKNLFGWYYAIDDTAQYTDTSTYNSTSQEWETVKEYVIPSPIRKSKFRLKIDIKSSEDGEIIRARFTKNGEAIGTEETRNLNNWANREQDLEFFDENDTIGVQLKADNEGVTASMKNFKICGIIYRQNINIDLPDWS